VAVRRALDAGERVTRSPTRLDQPQAVDAGPAELFVIAADPVVQGVIRLAADTAAGVGRVTPISADRLPASMMTAERPIVVLDLDGAVPSIAPVAAVLDVAPDVRVVVLSERDDGAFVLEAMRLGAFAVLRKPDGLHTLSEVLAQVAGGERVLPNDLEQSAVSELRRFARQVHAASTVATPVTNREREILELAAEGFTTHQIGRRLGISPRTVEAHIAKLYRKLGVKTRIQAITRAAALGLIDMGE
jgi:DNA-binding NarL/FixJ family response regulator